MSTPKTSAARPATQPAHEEQPAQGGRFVRLPDGSLQPAPEAAAATEPTTETPKE